MLIRGLRTAGSAKSTPSITKGCLGISSNGQMIYARRTVLSELRANLDWSHLTNNSVLPTQHVDRSRLNRYGVDPDCARRRIMHRKHVCPGRWIRLHRRHHQIHEILTGIHGKEGHRICAPVLILHVNCHLDFAGLQSKRTVVAASAAGKVTVNSDTVDSTGTGSSDSVSGSAGMASVRAVLSLAGRHPGDGCYIFPDSYSKGRGA